MKLFKKISIIVVLALLLLAGLGTLFTWKYADEIEQYGVTQVNALVKTQISVDEIEFSLFRKFPLASLAFKGVRAKEVVDRKQKGDLFTMESIYLEFNIWKVLRGQYEVKQITLENGSVNMEIDAHGKDNYHFWKESDEETSAFVLGLEAVQLKNVELTFKNEIKAFVLQQNFTNCAVKGKFSDKAYTLEAKGPVYVNMLKSGSWVIMKEQATYVDVKMNVDQEKDNYSIDKGAFSIAQLHFFLNGDFTLGEEASLLDLEFSGNKLDIAALTSLFPENIRKQLEQYNSEGEVQLKGRFTGFLSAKLSPEVYIDFNIKRGKVQHRSSGITLNEIVLAGHYENGSQKNLSSSSVKIDTIEARFGSGSIVGSYEVFNFEQPRLKLKANATSIDLEEVHAFLSIDTLETLKGQLNLQLKWNGLIDDLSKMTVRDFRKGNTVGKASLRNFELAIVNSNFRLDSLNGQLDFNNNDVKATELSGRVMDNPLTLNGYFQNLLPYLLDKNEKLLLRARLKADYLNWDVFQPENQMKQEGEGLFSFPERLSFQLDAEVGQFRFRRFNATNFKGKMSYHNSQFVLERATLNALGGNLSGSMRIDAQVPEKTKWSAKLTANEVDITALFTSFDHFGQSVISAENLKGIANANIEFASTWNRQWEVDLSSIETRANIEINKGELINYKPVYALSRFVEVEELNHIQFSSLQNEIEIRDSRIIIPEMRINSSALNLSLSGVHSFDNEIEYHFSLLLRDILSKKARKAKKENQEFGGYEEDDGLGRTTLFLKMTGTVDDPKISYDRKGLRKKWEKDLQEEKQTVKSIWKAEFGKQNENDAPTVEKEYDFQMEWEEEDKPDPVTPNKQREEKNPNPLKEAAAKDSLKRKGKVGKWFDKITRPNEEEYE